MIPLVKYKRLDNLQSCLDLMRKIGKTARQGVVSIPPADQKQKTEISAPQAVCGVVIAAPPKLFPIFSLIDLYLGMIAGTTPLGSRGSTPFAGDE